MKKVRQVYRIIPKAEGIKMLESALEIAKKSDSEFLIFSSIEFDSGRTNTWRGTVTDGMQMVSDAETVIYSNTPVLGSLDLYGDEIKEVENIRRRGVMKNILFPLVSR